ncbi:MAG: DUF2007-related protein [Bacteroidetes bacterium]|nr:DUF2007-related protein [Bacteroidota bacterium]
MKGNNETKPIEVFAGTPWQAGMVKTLLEDSGIEAFIADAIMGTMNPWWTAAGGAGAIRVFVSTKDFDKAKVIVDEYEKNFK